MAYKPYYEKLQDSRWKEKRRRILVAANFRCRQCGADDKTLNVHHSYYEKGKEPWEYPDESLSCLCRDCHKDTEDILASIRRRFAGLVLHDLIEIDEFMTEISRARQEWRERRSADTAAMACEYDS